MGKSRSKPPSAPAWTAPPYRKALLFVVAALVIVEAGIGILSPGLKGTWYGDDWLYLLQSPILYDPHRVWRAWFDPGSIFEYYPLEETVQWYQWRLWGLDSPFPYLVSNLALHLTSALLLWYLLWKLGLKLAWLGGLIFAIHPALADSVVGGTAELKNTLSLPPFLLAMCFYLDFESRRKQPFYIGSLLLFGVAMLCKITMAFFPLVILAYAWWKRGRVTGEDWKRAIPFFAVSLLLSWATWHARTVYDAASHYQNPGPIPLGGVLDRIALSGLSLSFYFGHSFLPVHPVPYYPLWPLEPLTPWLFLPWAAIVLVLACCWVKRHSWGRPVLFALLFFVLGMAPFLGLFAVSYMCLSWVQDHLLYLPIIALIGLLVAGLEDLARKLPKRLLAPLVSIVVGAVALLGYQTYWYATLFADHEQLWSYNLRYNPNSWMARHLYAVELAQRNDNADAIPQLQEALRLNPGFDNAWLTLGACLFKTGDLTGAIDSFQACLRSNPRYDGARLFLGFALSRDGRAPEAMEQFSTFARTHPDSAEVHLGLGQALAQQNRLPEAIAELEAALRLNPGEPTVTSELEALRQKLAQQNGPAAK